MSVSIRSYKELSRLLHIRPVVRLSLASTDASHSLAWRTGSETLRSLDVEAQFQLHESRPYPHIYFQESLWNSNYWGTLIPETPPFQRFKGLEPFSTGWLAFHEIEATLIWFNYNRIPVYAEGSQFEGIWYPTLKAIPNPIAPFYYLHIKYSLKRDLEEHFGEEIRW